MSAGGSSFDVAVPPWVAPPAAPSSVMASVTALRPGGFWRRAFALAVDAVIVWILLRVGAMGAAVLARWDLLAQAFSFTWTLVIPAAYFVVLHGSGGRTLGKALAGVRVVAASGEPLAYGRALARQLAWTLSALTLGVGFLVAAARADRRALHDLVAGTR